MALIEAERFLNRWKLVMMSFETHRQWRNALLAGTLLVALSMALLAACNDTDMINDAGEQTSHPPESYSGGELLVSVEWLAANLDDPDLVVVDLSQIRTYRSGHIPGAVHLWWQDTIEVHNEIYGMLADTGTRADLLRKLGISQNSFVVAYDDQGGRYAARLVWVLHAVGFESAAVLNGGRQAWTSAGFSLDSDRPEAQDGFLEQHLNYQVLIGADDVQVLLEEPGVLIVDGRTDAQRRETWFGRLRDGTIPGSIRLPDDRVTIDGPVPRFRSEEDLRAELPREIDPESTQTVIVYGLHGVDAAYTWLAMRLMGFQDVRLYDGSWAEWGADAARPVEPIEQEPGT